MAQVSTRVVAALAALSLAVPALAACSDDPPSGSPPPTSSSSPTSSATPSGPPTMPAAAKGRTPEAAEAFVRYYVDLINYGLETLDSAPLRAFASDGCRLCDGFGDALDRLEQRGGTYEGGKWSIRSLSPSPTSEPGIRVVQASVRIDAEHIVQASPSSEFRNKAHRAGYTFFVDVSGEKPRVSRIETFA